MDKALQAWLQAAALSKDPIQAATAAAEAVANNPWMVVEQAGMLARAKMTTAPHDLGLTADLGIRPIDAQHVVARVPKGAPFPAFDRTGRKKKGAFDTPRNMARNTVKYALEAATRPVQRGLDPSCGTGAFLVAMTERSIPTIQGIELDPSAAAVARVAAPMAQIIEGDGFLAGETADLVVGNPPFVPPERQQKQLRADLKRSHPWLYGRFDLAVPFAAISAERVARGGGVALILPAPMMVQPYAKPLRRTWVANHKITHLSRPTPFPGATVEVVCLAMTIGEGPATLPDHSLKAEDLLTLDAVPLNASLHPEDPALVHRIRSASKVLGTLCTVDTGVVGHGPHGSKKKLLHAQPRADLVPYVDARDLTDNRTQWLDYQPATMHRPKHPDLFEGPKVLVQRLRGRGPVRAWVDRSGLYAGHTLTVVKPHPDTLSPEQIHRLITDPLIDGLLRMERGTRLDLYPRDVRSIPVPTAWLTAPETPLALAWGLHKKEIERLHAFSRQ